MRIFVLLAFFVSGGFWLKAHVVEFGAKGFRYLPQEATLSEESFTGLSYKFYADSWRIYKIQFFWRGKQQLTEHRWFKNGVKWQEISFKHGLRHGKHYAWYEDGKVQSYRNYKDDLPHGEFWGWHPNGNVSDYHYFRDGDQLVYKSFISDGKPYYNYVYRDGKRVGLEGGGFCKTLKVSNL